MIDLGSTEFLLSVPSVSRREIEHLSSSLFDSWELFIKDSLAIPDYSLFLQVEEGSIKGAAKIGALLGAVYFGIGNYGDFISGVKTINEQLSATRDYLGEQAGRVFLCPDSRRSTRNRGGSLASLQRLFVKVQKGELTADEALKQAELLLGEEAATESGFLRDLKNSLHSCPRFHEQLPLALGDLGEDELPALDGTKRPSRTSRPRPPIGPALSYRVEVWRESKKKRKKTRVTRL